MEAITAKTVAGPTAAVQPTETAPDVMARMSESDRFPGIEYDD